MISLLTTIEREPDPEITVDFNGDDNDPAWRAYCESGYWAGTWCHADSFLAWDDDEDAWERACQQAQEEAAREGAAHRADVHHD